MRPLEHFFEHELPTRLGGRQPLEGESRIIAFHASSGPETGLWYLASDGSCGVAQPESEPDLMISANATVLMLLLTGKLDAERAIDGGALEVAGDLAVFQDVLMRLTSS